MNHNTETDVEGGSNREPVVSASASVPKILEAKVKTILSRTYKGLHHVPGEIKESKGMFSVCVHPLATFDFDHLTRLVIMCHEEAVRMEIGNGGPGRVKLKFWNRKREGDMFERHPTIEQAIEKLRSTHE